MATCQEELSPKLLGLICAIYYIRKNYYVYCGIGGGKRLACLLFCAARRIVPGAYLISHK
jgi:hypothetical protein